MISEENILLNQFLCFFPERFTKKIWHHTSYTTVLSSEHNTEEKVLL